MDDDVDDGDVAGGHDGWTMTMATLAMTMVATLAMRMDDDGPHNDNGGDPQDGR